MEQQNQVKLFEDKQVRSVWDVEQENMKEANKDNFKFAWRIIAAHVIVYFIAGLFASSLFN